MTQSEHLRIQRAGVARAAAFRKQRWLAWKATHNLKKRHEAWLLWQSALDDLHKLDQKIKALPPGRVSMAAVHGIAKWEGGQSSNGLFYPVHYAEDPPGVNTQGFGHIEGVKLTDRPWTLPKAYEKLRHDLDVKYTPATLHYFRLYGLRWNQKELDACVSFAYNLGWGYFEPNHDPGRAMARHDWKGLAETFMEFDKGFNHEVLDGLARRRRWERQLLLGGTYHVNN